MQGIGASIQWDFASTPLQDFPAINRPRGKKGTFQRAGQAGHFVPQLPLPRGVINSVATVAMDRDLELMLRIRRGDAESFEALLARHRTPLINFFLRMVHDHGLAEDLAQEVFLRVYKARERWKPDAKVSTWLYRIATNLALNAIRDRKGMVSGKVTEDGEGEDGAERLPDSHPGAVEQMMVSEREQIIREAVESLPENQRTAVVLHKYQEVDYRQIAKVLGVTESAVKSLLFRAYETLRARLEPLVKEGQV
jgi:RNA polymerase sigma-70 factor, ECF subfamily